MDELKDVKLDYKVFPNIGKIYYSSKWEETFIYREIFEQRQYIQYGIETYK